MNLIDLLVVDAEAKGSAFVFYLKPVYPCKVGEQTEELYSCQPYRGVGWLGPVSSTLGTILPWTVVIDPNTCEDLSMATLGPFRLIAYKWDLYSASLGDLLEEARKRLCPSSNSALLSSQDSSSGDSGTG